MTISIIGGELTLRCDNCGLEPKDLSVFAPASPQTNAVSRKKLASEARAKGWLIRRTAGSWQHFCPSCSTRRAGDISRQDQLL